MRRLPVDQSHSIPTSNNGGNGAVQMCAISSDIDMKPTHRRVDVSAAGRSIAGPLRAAAAGALAGSMIAVGGGALSPDGLPAAGAQSPNPSWFMEDANSADAYPAYANAVVVEALGMIGSCSVTPYTQSQVETAADNWINAKEQVVVEISPQGGCDGYSVQGYVSAIANVVQSIENAVGASAYGRYFGGMMLDEEPNYGFTIPQLESLNEQASSVTKLFPETANWSGSGWSLSDWEAITAGTPLAPAGSYVFVPSPQVYNSTMASYTNSMVAAGYAEAGVLVTCTLDATATESGWNSCTYAPGQISGGPWSDTNWGGGYWYNKWQPV